METIKFERGPAHDHVYFNEYRNHGERLVTIWQLVGGTMMAFGLMLAYVIVAWLEG